MGSNDQGVIILRSKNQKSRSELFESWRKQDEDAERKQKHAEELLQLLKAKPISLWRNKILAEDSEINVHKDS